MLTVIIGDIVFEFLRPLHSFVRQVLFRGYLGRFEISLLTNGGRCACCKYTSKRQNVGFFCRSTRILIQFGHIQGLIVSVIEFE